MNDTTNKKSVINLDVCEQKTTPGESFAKENHPCNGDDKYEDIFYATGTNCFWLVKNKANKKINAAIKEIEQKIFPVERKKAVEAMSSVGLDDCFVVLSTRTFLSDEQKKEWDELSVRLAEDDKFIAEHNAKSQAEWEENRKQPLNTDLSLDVIRKAQQRAVRIRLRRMQAQKIKEQQNKDQNKINQLTAIAEENARSRGFLVEEHHFFDPKQKKIKNALDKYAESLDVFIDKTETPESAIQKQKKWLKNIQDIIAQHGALRPEVDDLVKKAKNDLEKMEHSYQTRLSLITELAGYGVAVPEYALSIGAQQQCKSGEECLSRWHLHLKNKQKHKAKMEEILSAFKISTDRAVRPPKEAFRDILGAMAKEQKAADELYKIAAKACESAVPPLLLIWEPKIYKKPELKCIANPSFPLREIHRASATDPKKIREYFSLKSISTASKKVRDAIVSGDVGKTQKSEIKPSNLMPYHISNLNGDPALEDMLKDDGILKIPLSGSWFNAQGFFIPDLFYKYLKTQKLHVIALDSHQASWEKKITRFLFQDFAENKLKPVDESPGAMFFRFTTTAPTWSTDLTSEIENRERNFVVGSLSTQVEISVLRAEYNLFDTYWPKSPKKVNLPLKITTRKGEEKNTTLDLGGWQVHANCKYWGFIGACMKINANLDQKLAGFARSSATKKEVDGASFEGFVGAQVGASVTGELLWDPPSKISQNLAPDVVKPLVMGKLQATAVVAAGVSFKVPLTIHYDNGRFFMKVRPTFWGGIGFNTTQTYEVDIPGVMLLLEIFQDLLREADYGYIEVCDDSTFNVISRLGLILMLLLPMAGASLFATNQAYRQQCLLEVGLIAARGKDWLDSLFAIFERSHNAALVAYTMSGHLLPENHITLNEINQTEEALKKWVRLLTPEAIGSLLMAMTAEPEDLKIENSRSFGAVRVKSLQQMTIARVITWIWNNQTCSVTQPIADQHRYQEAISRMNSSDVGDEDAQKYEYKMNIKILGMFMKMEINQDLRYVAYMKEYVTANKKLSCHLLGWS